MTLATIAWLSAEVDSSLQKLENDRNFNTFASKVYLNIYLRQVKKNEWSCWPTANVLVESASEH